MKTRITFLRVCKCGRVQKLREEWIMIHYSTKSFFEKLLEGVNFGDEIELRIFVECCPYCRKKIMNEPSYPGW